MGTPSIGKRDFDLGEFPKLEDPNFLSDLDEPSTEHQPRARLLTNYLPPTKKVGPYEVLDEQAMRGNGVIDGGARFSLDEMDMKGDGVIEGTVARGEWKDFKVGLCKPNPNSLIPTASLERPITPAVARKIMEVSKFTDDEFYLDKNSTVTGVFCYSYQSPVARADLLNADCKKLFPKEDEILLMGMGEGYSSSSCAQCEQVKAAVGLIVPPENDGDSLTSRLIELGFLGLAFGVVSPLFNRLLDWAINKVKGPPRGPTFGGGWGGGGGGRELSGAELFNGRYERRINEPGLESDTLACWGASFLLGLLGVVVVETGSVVAGGLGTAGVYVGEAAGAVSAGALATASAAAVGFGLIYSQGAEEYSPLVPMHRWHGR